MVNKITKLFNAYPVPFRAALTPFEVPDFRRLWVSNFLWWATRFMELIAVGWLVLELTNSAWQVAMIGFYRSAPFLVVGFVSGSVIDRFGRRNVILASQGLNIVIYVILTFLLWSNQIEFWHLATGALIMGTAWSLDWPARRSFVPDLVGKSKTVDALLLENFGQNIARIAGPFAGGVLIGSFGVLGAYIALLAISMVALVVLVGLTPQPLLRKASAAGSSSVQTLIEGLRYVQRNPAILGALLITVAMNFFIFPYNTLLPVFARDVLHQGPVGLGILGAASGIGAFLGIFIINYVRRYASNGWILATGSAFFAAVVLAFSLSTSFPLSWALLFLTGIGQASFGIMQSSIILLSASDEMRNRAMGTLVLAIGVGPLGQLQMGASADSFGAPVAVGISAFIAALSVIGIAVALPGLRQQPQPNDDVTTAPAYAGSSAR